MGCVNSAVWLSGGRGRPVTALTTHLYDLVTPPLLLASCPDSPMVPMPTVPATAGSHPVEQWPSRRAHRTPTRGSVRSDAASAPCSEG
jgi:hypothetical protein